MRPMPSDDSQESIDECKLQTALGKMLNSSWIGSTIVRELLLRKLPTIQPEHISSVEATTRVRDSSLGIKTIRNRETDIVINFRFVNNNQLQTAILLVEVK